MALAGYFSTNKYNNTVGLKLSWYGVQSIADNTTRIYWTLQSDGGSTSQWWYSAPITVVIGGKTALSVTSRFKMYGGGKYKKTGNLIISHNSDGTKSVAMSVKGAIYSSSVNCTGSRSYNLDKIDRYALIDSVSSFTDEENPVIIYSNSAGTELVNNLKLRMSWRDEEAVSHYTDWIDDLNDAGGSYTFDLDDYRTALRQACADSRGLLLSFELQSTLDGTDYVDSYVSSMNIVNDTPVIQSGATSYADTNSSIVSITHDDQIIVQMKSYLTVHVDTSKIQAQKEASIESIKVYFFGEAHTPDSSGNVELGIVRASGLIQGFLNVIDSRGNEVNEFINITVEEWQIPSATWTLARVNGFEDETILTVNAVYSSVNSINQVIIQEQHKRKGTSVWSQAVSVQDGVDFSINSPTGLDKQYEWDVRILISDLFYTPSVVEYGDIVGKGVPLFYPDFKRNSIGVNGFPDDDNQVYIDGDLKVTGDIQAQGIHWSDRIQQVTLTQNVTINTPNASGYFQLDDDLDFPFPNAILIGMQVRCQQIANTSGTIYQLVWWEDGQKPYIMYQHANVNFSNISHDFIFSFYVP